jgi:hypothetical protein
MPSSTKGGYLALSLVSATLLFCFPFHYIIAATICYLWMLSTQYQRFSIQQLAWLLVFSSSPLLTLHLFLKLAA